MVPEKIRIIITGPKVHEVGYRYWLMNQAMSLGIEGFNAINVTDSGKQQQVVVLLEDLPEALDAFKALVNENKPERAMVSKISFEDYPGKVTRLSNFAQALTAGQLLKAIPILQDIQDQVKVLPDIQDKVKVLPDILNQVKVLPDIQDKVKVLPDILNQVKVLPEIRDYTAQTAESLREDRMVRMERDIRTIKAKLGMA
jgi:acylphosphatase